MRQHIATAVLDMNLTDGKCMHTSWRTPSHSHTLPPSANGHIVLSFSAFVNADLNISSAIMQMRWDPQLVRAPPSLEWVDKSGGKAAFAWLNTSSAAATTAIPSSAAALPSSAPSLTLYACIYAGKVADARAVVRSAAAKGTAALLSTHTKWWAHYWAQSFVSLPVTRAEGFYATEMYRFVSADRVTLMGLMGAFGPTDNFNLWSDYVWVSDDQR
jgi:hypothetical protein